MIIDEREYRRRYLLRIKGARDNKVYIGPETVSLDLINLCNLSCRFCSAQHAPNNPFRSEKARLFEWDDFLGVVGDCVDLKVNQLYLVGPGEPTLHPRFRDMMQHLERQPITTKLFTNATFSPEYCADVLKGDHVIINLNAIDRQGYVDLKGKDLFDRVVANIERLVSLRNTVKPEFGIKIAYILNAVTLPQKEKMLDLASGLGVDMVNVIEMHGNAYNQDIALPQGSPGAKKTRTPPACLNGWFYMAVKLDDSASICCQIHKMPFGDFDKGHFKRFWLSQRLMNLRLMGKYGQLQKMFKACKTCPDYEENIERAQRAGSGRPAAFKGSGGHSPKVETV
ncbi:MAG: radical SAM protein [Candidatus Omnitrophica bacterium]|nr:radical SAM protein [Candidatus Omnitrophota bacterium]